MTDINSASPSTPEDAKKSTQPVDGTDDPGSANPLLPFIPNDIKKPTQRAIQKLTAAADGADNVADDLGEAVDRGLEKVEQKLDNFITGLDKFLGKF